MSRSAPPATDLITLIAAELIFGDDLASEDRADEETPDDGALPPPGRKGPDR